MMANTQYDGIRPSDNEVLDAVRVMYVGVP